MAEEVRERLSLERIMFIPSCIPPLKGRDVIDAEHRLNMVKLAVSDNEHFLASDVEYRRTGISYTVDTLKILINEEQLRNPLFILGIDSFLELPLWHRPEEIIELTDFVIVTRAHHDVQEAMASPYVKKNTSPSEETDTLMLELITGKRALILRCTNLDISASSIRESIRKGRSIRYLLPDNVISYINENNLYRG